MVWHCCKVKTFPGIYVIELMKPTDKVDKILTNGNTVNAGAKWMELIQIHVILHDFILESRLILVVQNKVKARIFW